MEIIHISQECPHAVSARTLGLAPTWLRFTQTHFCTFMSLSCPPTEQLAPQYQLTPRQSQFSQIWHMMCCVLDNTWTPYFQSATFSLPHWYIILDHPHVILHLHHYRLTSSLNHSIHWLPHLCKIPQINTHVFISIHWYSIHFTG